MKSKRFLYLILPALTLVLEIIPYGAVLNFATSQGEPLRKTYSYFSLTPYGYANITPLITAILTCIIFALMAVFCITGKRRPAQISKGLLCLCTILSQGQLLFGISYLSFASVLITISLAAELILLHLLLLKLKKP